MIKVKIPQGSVLVKKDANQPISAVRVITEEKIVDVYTQDDGASREKIPYWYYMRGTDRLTYFDFDGNDNTWSMWVIHL